MYGIARQVQGPLSFNFSRSLAAGIVPRRRKAELKLCISWQDNGPWGNVGKRGVTAECAVVVDCYSGFTTRFQHLRMPVESVSSSIEVPSTHFLAGGPIRSSSIPSNVSHDTLK
jgi:hypothetical protein